MPYLPEDIRPQWLSIFRRIQSVVQEDPGKNKLVHIYIVIDADGYPVQWTEPQTSTIFVPKTDSKDNPKVDEWLKVVRRLQSVAKSENYGNALISLPVIVDIQGRPVLWLEPERRTLEPKRLAKEAIETLAKIEDKGKRD